MKPEKFKEMPTPSDISEASVEYAKEMLEAQEIHKHMHWVIRVPSQSYSRAFEISKSLFSEFECYVDLDMSYEYDEWSLEARWYDFDAKIMRVAGVWNLGV